MNVINLMEIEHSSKFSTTMTGKHCVCQLAVHNFIRIHNKFNNFITFMRNVLYSRLIF